jgi:hypothetical protein
VPGGPSFVDGRGARAAAFYGAALWRGPVVGDRAGTDHLGMSLLDRSPGGFVAVANTILYAVVLLETWMLTTASMAAMVMTMGVIIVVAAWLCRWMLNLLGPEDHALDYEPQPARAAKPATVPAPAPAAPARVVARPVIQ